MRIELIRAVAARTMRCRCRFRVFGFGAAVALRGLLRATETSGGGEPAGFVLALLRAPRARGVGKAPEEHVAPGAEVPEGSNGGPVVLSRFCDGRNRIFFYSLEMRNLANNPAFAARKREPLGEVRRLGGGRELRGPSPYTRRNGPRHTSH